MTTRPIIESGMNFGPPTPRLFHVEKSTVYAVCPKGVKMVELLLLNKSKVLLVEAKQSSPKPDNQPDFRDFMTDIREKMTNALSLFMGARLGRYGALAKSELPSDLAIVDLAQSQFRFVLIIKGHKAEWLGPLQEELNLELRGLAGAFAIQAPFVAVMNDIMAREHKLIA